MRKQPLLALMSATLTFTMAGAAGRHHLAGAETDAGGSPKNARAHVEHASTSPGAPLARAPRAPGAREAPSARETPSAPRRPGGAGSAVLRAEVATPALRPIGTVSLLHPVHVVAEARAVHAAVVAHLLHPTAALAHRSAAHRSAAYRPPGGVWLALRRCESGDDYTMDSGNGYYGAYQFSLSTWQDIGFPGMPSQAPPQLQDQAAARLEAEQGWEPWPVCSLILGLR